MVKESTIDEQVTEYLERMNRRVVKHILKASKNKPKAKKKRRKDDKGGKGSLGGGSKIGGV
jgi:hypothetical protein